MKKFYYCLGVILFLFYNNSYSQNCSALEILTTTPGSVCGEGSVTLGATASGVGDDIYWYDAASGGTFLGAGSLFETPSISATTSYWATEVFATGVTVTGQAKPAPTTSSNTTGSGWGLVFDANQSFTIADVEVFSAGSGGNLVVELQDATGTMLQSASTTVPGGGSGTSPVPHTVSLNFNVPAAGTYRLIGISTPTLIREFSSANTYPYPLGSVGSVTSGYISGTSQTYYWFYNWTITTGSVTCESTPREEVIATVNNVADEDVLSLPYTHTANTATYFNNYSGAPGAVCGSSDSYLDGNDVVYKYTADNDYILTVELSGLSEPYSGVFIYESCLDIGASCFAEGSFNETTGTHSFQVAVQNTNDYFIVVSSADPTISMNYTLTINGTTCANYPAPTGPAAQNFIVGQTLADLNVTGTNLTWYSDVALTTVIPDDTALVDLTTYYVTQSFQGCEGAALAVTVNEVPCTSLDILSTVAGSVCGEGFVILEAQGAEPAVNTEIYWYDAATGGNLVGKGSPFTTPELEQTTSFWATEAAISGGELAGQAKTAPSLTTTTTLTNYGLQFNVFTPFTLVSVEVYPTTGGVMDLELRDAAGTVLETVTGVNVPSGNGTTPVTLTLNMDIPAGNGLRLLKSSSGSPTMIRESSGNVYPYAIGTVGEITGGALNQGNPLTAYYWFYNWTITEAVALCESSPREEVIATVNNVADELVTEPLPFVHTANTSTYGNNYEGDPGIDCSPSGGNYLNGADVVYQYSPTVGGVYSIDLSGLSSNNAAVFVYESCYDIGTACYTGAVSDGTTNNFGIAEVPMYDGFDYFIVVSTSDSPFTDYTITIDLATINCADYTAAPGGDADQFFEPGETLADLDVNGGNLTWYSDAAGTTVIPNTTLLVDGTTYYVNQTLNGCVSNLLAITVTEIDCSSLEILTTTDATIVCKGTAVLEAVGNGGPGTEIYWYSNATASDPIATGGTFTTPLLTATTSYWVGEVFIEDGSGGGSGTVGPVNPAAVGTAGGGLSSTYEVLFDVLIQTTLVSVDIYPTAAIGSSGSIDIRDNAGNVIINVPYTTTVTGGATPQTIPFNVALPQGTGYKMVQANTVALYRNTSGASYPYTSTAINITGNSFGAGYYYHFYNWEFSGGTVLCESPRKEVIATVSQDGDIIIPAALPYIDANNNTSNYGNTFSGAPGTACGTTENYLNGNDVVYMYTPTMDDVIDIHLKDITAFYGGLFVYESCADIGTNCVAGVVAGPSQNDISIEEFSVLAGETYYIVVSSWLSSSIGYTLEINGFVCATFPAPIGDAVQNFAAPATLADLDAEGTMSASVLTWYSDAAGTIIIPDTTPLVDGTTYYVSQTFGTCESPLLAITVDEIDCSNLNILSTTNGLVVCLGSMTLEAVGSGSGDEIYWYDAQTGGNLVGTGSTFTTPVLTTTTSFWAAEVYLEQGSGSNALPSPCTPVHGSSGCGVGDNIDNFVLSEAGGAVLINHLGTGCSTNAYGDFTGDPNLTAVLIAGSDYDVDMTHTFASSQWAKIWIDFNFDGVFDTSELIFQSTSGSSGGVTNGTFTIPSSVIGSNTIMRVSVRYAGLPADACNIGGTYGETHDYKVTVVGSSALCESPRVEAIATVDQTGDITVGPLPYTDQNNTINFGNNFSGGSGCSGVSGNYLDGNDVVYQFTPANDDIINIELSGVASNTGVFVYESCGDIGGNCLAGSVGNGTIEDFLVTGGQDYFIVIGSQSGSTGYTLNIYGYDCLTDLGAPEGDADQFFVGVKDLTNLTVDEYIHSTGLTWYSNAAGTIVIPETTTLVDNTTYYVSQTVLGCTSPLLAITAHEFACSDLIIVSVTDDVVCQSGSMTLTAQPGGIGNEIYWYDAATGGNIVGVGQSYDTPILTTTTSYWAEEVYIEGSAPLSGIGKTAPASTTTFSTTSSYGLVFNATQSFNLMSVDVYPDGPGGTINVELWDAGTSNVIASVTVTVPPGNGTTPHTIPLNFQIPPGQNYRLIKTSNTAINFVREFSGNSFPYPISNVGEILGGTFNTGNPLGTYYWFYNWTIGDGIVLCESPRVEAVAEVNTTLPPAPTGAAAQDFCGTDNRVGDIVVAGDNIKWYNAAGNPLSTSTVLVNGNSYFATQTVDACEGNALEVVVTIVAESAIPQGDRNQPYVQGETLADLDVTGNNLLWYSDPLGNNPLPVNTLLVDQTTYFVTQTVAGLCESETLDVKVHRTLDVDDIAFANLVFYPNPALDYVTITNTGVIDSVEVFSLLGQRVIQQNVNALISKINVTDLASGPYLLTIKIDGKTGVYKLIKK